MTMRIDPRFLADVKARVSLVDLIGPSLQKLQRAGHDWRALCPFHHERTPSFYIVEKKGFWHCFGCGEHGDAVKWIIKTTTVSEFRDAVEYLAARVGLRQGGPQLEAKPIVKRDGEEAKAAARDKKVKNAHRIWHDAVAIDGTPAEAYLRHRGIRLELPPTLRFQPRLAHPCDQRRRLFPAMVAAIQGGDRQLVGVHCTYLEEGYGRWVKMKAPEGIDPEEWRPKIMRGACWGGAIRLTPIEHVMVLGEGIETSFSLLQAAFDEDLGVPHIDGEPIGVAAGLSLNGLGAVQLPENVREVILAADGDTKVPTDDQRDPEELLDLAAARHRDKGRNARIARPEPGSDFNDMLGLGAGGRGANDREDA